MAVANNVSKDTIKRFIWSLRESEKKLPFDIVLGQHKNPKQKFYKTVILNDMIRKIIKRYDVLVQTDIDMLIPPRLIQHSLNYCLKNDACLHCNYHMFDWEKIQNRKYQNINWEKISQSKNYSASGSWNALRNYMWNEISGFSEAISLLGGPDSEFYMRSKKLGIRWSITSQFPLVHINHPRRKVRKQGKRNLAAARKFPLNYNWLKHRTPDFNPTKINIVSIG